MTKPISLRCCGLNHRARWSGSGTPRKFSLVQQLRQLFGVQETWWTRRLRHRVDTADDVVSG